MKILSFDQAANVSGWSYWEDAEPVEWGAVKPSPQTLRGGERLVSLRKQFEKLIDKYDPDIVLIENPVGGEEDKKTGAENNWKTMQVLCQVQGVLLELIASKKKKIDIISPSSWQDTCGIHKRSRDERKAGAQKFVKNQYHIDVIQDICDSICIAYHYIIMNELEGSAF